LREPLIDIGDVRDQIVHPELRRGDACPGLLLPPRSYHLLTYPHGLLSKQDVANIKGLGGDLKDLVRGTKSTISFVKVISDLDGASQVNLKEVAKLLAIRWEQVDFHHVACLGAESGG
jgi:hypothetical protein